MTNLDDDADTDGDGIVDTLDNCPGSANPEQAARTATAAATPATTARSAPNADQADGDGDGVGDACETVPPQASSN